MIELTQQTFKRIVGLYLLTTIAGLLVAIIQTALHSDFSSEFDNLSARYFGAPSDVDFIIFGAVAIPAFIAHFCAIFGLLRFRRWARLLLWTSLVVMLLPALNPSLSVTWSVVWSWWIEIFGSALLGMIILLAYSRDHGALWFGKNDQIAKESE